MQQYKDSWIENLSWPLIERRINDGATAILPVGAASKEHGRHLPLNTDYRQAEWLASAVAEHENVLIWPVVHYGYYPVFVDYPGSISIGEATFGESVSAIIDGIYFAGVSKLVVINTGISTIPILSRLTESQRDDRDLHLHNAYAGEHFAYTVAKLSEQKFGGHADEIETSIMLALDESVVNLDLASPQATEIRRGLFNRTDPDQANYSPDGVNGNPCLASRQKGEALLQALLADCLAAFS